MPNSSPTVQLSWTDPSSQQQRQPILTLPITFGRLLDQMPLMMQGQSVSRMVLLDPQVSRYHALIEWSQGQLVLTDQSTPNGTIVNGSSQRRCILTVGDRIQIGSVNILVQQISGQAVPGQATNEPSSQTSYQVQTIYPGASSQDVNAAPPALNVAPASPPIQPAASPTPAVSTPRASQPRASFPPDTFKSAKVVSIASLEQRGHFQRGTDEVVYAALGAGLGSYIWVDYLRICGVRPQQIIAIGTQDSPYAKYKQLCLNSQIPLHERLRSNSDSCPDNIWGWPSYALREAWDEFGRGHLDRSFRYLWLVFGEPTLVETYTPRADKVFDSIDREAQRIGWPDIYRYGSIRAIRKTDDGRYAVAYSKGQGQYGYVEAK